MTTFRSTPTPSRISGFTLIEVMIVVAIVAILAMISYPAYRDYIIRGNVPSATTGLATKQVQMEQFFQDRRSYLNGDSSLPANMGTIAGCVADTTGKYFDFSCAPPSGVVPTATAYTIAAVGKGNMAGFTYTITQSGVKATVSVPAGWSLPAPNNCWVTKKGGIC